MRLTMIGVGNLMEVIWPVIGRVVGGDDRADRIIGVTADADDAARKEAHFGFPIVLDDNLGALRRNRPDLILFSPPPTVAPELIESVLRPYYEERRADGGPLPVLYAFPPVPLGQAYLDALGHDVLVVNMIPNNVTSIAGDPVVDEGHYTVTYPAPWPEERVRELQDLFAGQGTYVEVEPHQIVPMLGGLTVIASLWHVVPVVADRFGLDHNTIGGLLRADVRGLIDGAPASPPLTDDAPTVPEPRIGLLSVMARAWYDGVTRYYAETDLAPDAARTFVDRHLDLVLHTVEAEPRSVLHDLAVGAATKGGVLERAIRCADEELLPALTGPDGDEDISGGADGDGEEARLRDLVTAAAHTVRRHGQTLAG